MPKGVYDRSVRLTAEQKKERRAIRKKLFRHEHRERLLEQQRKHYSATREQRQEKIKKYASANRKSRAEYIRKHRKENPEVFRQCERRHRALKLNATVGDGSEIVAWETKWRSRQTVTCHWCRKRIKTAEVQVDHVVPLSKGGTHALENLCVSCESCNKSKHAKLPQDWNAKLKQPLLFV